MYKNLRKIPKKIIIFKIKEICKNITIFAKMLEFPKISKKLKICTHYNFCENVEISENFKNFNFLRKCINLRNFPQIYEIFKKLKICHLSSFAKKYKFSKKSKFANILIFAKML